MEQPIVSVSQPAAEGRPPIAIGLPTVAGLVAGAMLLVLAAALLAGRPPGEGSVEVRFARDMITHHEQAVEMALIIRERAEDETVRVLADDIILTQQNQAGRMAGWLEVWGRPFASEEAPMSGHAAAMGMAPQSEVNALRTLPVAEAETRFLQLMITHHEGGVIMAQDVLDAGARPEVERLAEAMIRGQRQENELMRSLLAARGAEAPPPLAPHHH